ncbi:hypothetical protein RKE38_13640 [Phycicoccus sp. M110.8]|uniref:hypothetical protein n=1 Tax=Phycicoccus sp. M110.8 TaxID=3075433 RepID=UPI0028FD62B3|nr:hypothetical protein [Phycicoccus sp. M110.8]MDU0314736.1 hypothetical protein [Phycicoccus sp. M110.8]
MAAPSVTAFTVNQEHARPVVYDASSTDSITASNTWGDDVAVRAVLSDGSSMSVSVMPPMGQRFAPGTYALGNGIDTTHAAAAVDGVGYTCSTVRGTLTVISVERSSTGSLTGLAADFDQTCDYQIGHQSGQVRWNSTVAYAGFRAAGAEFAPQPILERGGARTLTLTAAGSTSLSAQATRVVAHADSATGSFAIASDACSGRTLQPGDSCSVSVTMTPLVFGAVEASVELTTSEGVMTYLPLYGTGTASSKGTFHSVPSTRVLDTRSGTGGWLGAVGAGQTVSLRVGGVAGTPTADVAGVVLNLTVTQPTTTGYVTVYPADRPRPTVSSLNFHTGQTRANLVTVPVSPNGTIKLTNALGYAHLIADLVGYYSATSNLETTVGAGSQYQVLSPTRVVDTRDGQPLQPGQVLEVKVDFFHPERNAPVTGVAVNITAVSPTRPGYLTVWDGVGRIPGTSSLNFTAGENVPNLAVVAVAKGSDGVPTFAIANSSAPDTNVLVDLVGLYEDSGGTGLRFRSVTPQRIVDTRTGLAGVRPSIPANATRTFGAPASTVTDDTRALVGNLTAVKPSSSTFLTVWPGTGNRPATSSLNAPAGAIVANALMAQVGSANGFSIYNKAGTTPTLVDVMGTMESYPPRSAGATADSQQLVTQDWTPWQVTTARR